MSTGSRLRARPIRPRCRSSRSCSCWTGSKPLSRRIRGGLGVPLRFRAVVGGPSDGEEVVDHRPEDAEQLAGVGAAVGEVVDVGPAVVGQLARPRRDHPGHLERVIARTASSRRPSNRASASVPWG